MHWAALSPVRALGSVALHGPWLPDSPNAWYIAKPAFPPVSALPPPVPRSLGVIVPPLNKPGASVTFVEPKAQTATPLAITRVAEVSLMLLLAVAVPVVLAPNPTARGTLIRDGSIRILEKLLTAAGKSDSPSLLPLLVLEMDTGLRAAETRVLQHKDLELTWDSGGAVVSGRLIVPKSKTEAWCRPDHSLDSAGMCCLDAVAVSLSRCQSVEFRISAPSDSVPRREVAASPVRGGTREAYRLVEARMEVCL